MANYYQDITTTDQRLGQVMGSLKRHGFEEDTLLIYTSDQGPEWPRSKWTTYDAGLRVPFIARWPGRIRPGTTNAALFGLVDMPATLAALTGVPLPGEAAPDSFNALPALLNEPGAKPVRDHLVFHNGGTNGPFGLRMGQWKLIVPARAPRVNRRKAAVPARQLYDLALDLGETNNLATSLPAKLEGMQALLAKIRQNARSRP